MLANFSSPILSVSVDALKDLDGAEALTGLWFLFTKCQSSVNKGKRLENISWRLWSQQIAERSVKYRTLTPDSPFESTLSLCGLGSITKDSAAPSTRAPIGKILCDMLPNSPPKSQLVLPKLRLPPGTTKAELEVKNSASSSLPTPAAELLSISIIPPAQSSGEADATSAPASYASSASVLPAIGLHASLSSDTSTPAAPFPVVVVVNHTPNPTPHPTPPATPVIPPTIPTNAVGHTHVQLPPSRLIPESTTMTLDRRPSNFFLAPSHDSGPVFQTRSSAHALSSGSRPSIPANLLLPSSLADSTTSVSPASPKSPNTITSSTNLNLSHLTATSSTSVHSNHMQSPNATLKPHDARIFFLKHGDEPSSGSSDSLSPVRAGARSDTSSMTHISTGNSNSTASGAGIYSMQPAKLTGQASHGQGSASEGSWGESDVSDERRHNTLVNGSRPSRRAGSTTSSSNSRSRSRSWHTHDRLMMSSRKKAPLVARKRLGGLAHSNAPVSVQPHAQGQQNSRVPSEPTTSVTGQERERPLANGIQHPLAQVPPPAPQGKRPMYSIGSQSPRNSPSNTDLLTSSRVRTRPPAPSGERKAVSPSSSVGRTKMQGVSSPVAPHQPPPLVAPVAVSSSPRQPRGLPHACADLTAAEAVIQAPRTKKVVLADDDDDDWDETDTDLDSDSEDRKSDVDAEKGGTNRLSGGENDNDEGGWVSEEDGPGASVLPSVAPSSKKSPSSTLVSVPKENLERYQSQPNIPSMTLPKQQQQQQPPHQQQKQPNKVEPEFRQPQTRPPSRPNHTAVASRTSRRSDREIQQQQAFEQKFSEAAMEAQRQREMFTKVPTPSYSNLPRTSSGLLSQLMNPDPGTFPDSHPYKRGYSSDGVAVGGRNSSGLTRMGIQSMLKVNGEIKSNLTAGVPSVFRALLAAATTSEGDPSVSRVPDAAPSVSRRSSNDNAVTLGSSFSEAAPLKPTKSAAALPVANSVTASSCNGDLNMLAVKVKGKQREQLSGNGSLGGYRFKGRPQDEEMEGESEDDPNQGIQMSKSAAQEKLAAFAVKQSAKSAAIASASRSGSRGAPPVPSPPPPPPPPVLHPYPDPIPPSQPRRSQSHHVGNASAHEASATPPVAVRPLVFPYNLPPAAPPSSPRTTRQLMLRKEISESLRQNLLWSRKVTKQEFFGPRRSSSTALSPTLQSLTALPSVVRVTKKKSDPVGSTNTSVDGEPRSQEQDEDDDVVSRPSKMQRNRSWAGGGR